MKNVPELGALILTAKREETQNWIEYAKAAGREDDLIIFNFDNGRFDPLHYEFTRKGRGSGDQESIVELFNTLVSLGDRDAGHSHDPFWSRGCDQLIRNVTKLLELAGEPISIVHMDEVIKSLPTRVDECEEEEWLKDSYCAQLVSQIRARKDTLTDDQWGDLEIATNFLFTIWPAFDERPRSSLAMTWSGMADRFLFSPYNRLFCGGACSFTPEMVMNDHKIIVCDFPMLEVGFETGRLINVLLKLVFMRAFLRRDLAESPNPVLLWQDEFQYFVTKKDNLFHETCRGARVAVVCLTQNILAIAEALGETHLGAKTKSLLGNFATKIFLQQNETETADYAADQIGREYRALTNYGHSSGHDGHSSFNAGASQTLAHIVNPVTFSRLKKPDANNPLAESIVFQSGRAFEITKDESDQTGKNYLRVFFSREGDTDASK